MSIFGLMILKKIFLWSFPKDSHKKTALLCMLTPVRLLPHTPPHFLSFWSPYVPHGSWLWSLDILIINVYFFLSQEDYISEGKGNLNAAIIKIYTVMPKPLWKLLLLFEQIIRDSRWLRTILRLRMSKTIYFCFLKAFKH